MRLKTVISFIVLALIGIATYSYFIYQDCFYFIKPSIDIAVLEITSDKDLDGMNDLDDIVQGARKEITNRTQYKSDYYKGGYPPDDEGVCTDVIWRALSNAGYIIKDKIDKDIKENTNDYPRVNDSPDPNIDFRRVKNQYVFFKKYAQNLTIEVYPVDKENLKEWQRGDIVVLKNPDHIAIISDKRTKDGVPFIIHNSYSIPKEENKLVKWYNEGQIIGHFRYPKTVK